MLISYLLNNLYAKVQFGSYVAGRIQQKDCARSLQCCEVSIERQILRDWFGYKPFLMFSLY